MRSPTLFASSSAALNVFSASASSPAVPSAPARVVSAFTSPTAVRLLMRYGNAPARAHDLSSLERVFCAGEVLNAPAWEWFQKEALQDKIPVIDGPVTVPSPDQTEKATKYLADNWAKAVG